MVPDWLLSQRARFATWTPIIMLLLLIPLSQTSFAEIEHSTKQMEEDEETSESGYVETYYSDYFIAEFPSEDLGSENYSDYFDGEVTVKNSYENVDDSQRKLKTAANELDGEINTITIITFSLIIFCLVNQREKFELNRYVNYQSIKGLLLFGISIYCIFAFFSITSGLSDYSDSVKKESKMFGENSTFDEGIWGSSEIKVEIPGFATIESTQNWSPDLLLLLLIPCIIISLVGSIANFSYLKSDLPIEDSDPYFGFENQFTNALAYTPIILVSILIISVVGSMIMPWHSIEQTWEMEKTEEEFNWDKFQWETINATYHTADFSWSLNPFYVNFNNDTSLSSYENFDGDEESSINSFSDHPEFSNSAGPILELRWPMICIFILGVFFIAYRYVEKISDYISGNNNGWTILVIVSILFIYSYGGIGNYDENFSDEIGNDISKLSPSIDLYSLDSPNDSSMAGSVFSFNSVTTDFSFTPSAGSQYSVNYFVLTEWNPSIGYHFAQIVPLMIICLLSIMLLPNLVRQINNYENGFKFEFDRNVWIGRPTIFALCGILLASMLGTGLGELVIDSKSAAPESVKKWKLEYNRTGSEDGGFVTMAHEEEIVIELEPGEIGILDSVQIFGYCEEGATAPTQEYSDWISWELTPPTSINTSEMYGDIEGEVECRTGQYFSTGWYNLFEINSNYASSEEEFLDGVSYKDPTGPWILKITARTAGGFTEFDSDPDLDFSHQVSFYGRDNLVGIEI